MAASLRFVRTFEPMKPPVGRRGPVGHSVVGLGVVEQPRHTVDELVGVDCAPACLCREPLQRLPAAMAFL